MLQAITTSCDSIDIAFVEADLLITSCKDRRAMLDISWSTTSALQDWPITTSEGLRNLLVFDSITKLTLWKRIPNPYASSDLGRVLELLSNPKDIDGITRWQLPNLQILRIVRDELTEQEQLVNIICNRCADRESRDMYEPPEKLRSLRLESKGRIDDNNWEAMRNILG
ncbi:hypothetical protein FRB94_012828 [Tulasnella sp. JGI-2019a]|nr:hypothetical protein FRB94_012828 [Tulasnella sp. JGI-2019a]KAG9016403.1 hypothetical protein FRB93_010652 [Tulasnella sp. JGI-2019a]